jgi:hypothetical protein
LALTVMSVTTIVVTLPINAAHILAVPGSTGAP